MHCRPVPSTMLSCSPSSPRSYCFAMGRRADGAFDQLGAALPVPTTPACPGSRVFSFVLLVVGNASFGTATPSRSQIGSQPSDTVHSSRRSAGTPARTSALWRSNASIILVGFSRSSEKRSSNILWSVVPNHCSSPGGILEIGWKIVFDVLRYQASGSRVESNTRPRDSLRISHAKRRLPASQPVQRSRSIAPANRRHDHRSHRSTRTPEQDRR